MNNSFKSWLDDVIIKNNPGGQAIIFNMYEEDDNKWSLQFTTTNSFNVNNEDWACDEFFSTGENLYVWTSNINWEGALAEAKKLICEYLSESEYSTILKAYKAIAVGFVDGDIHFLYHKD